MRLAILGLSALIAGCGVARAQPASDAGPTTATDTATDTDTDTATATDTDTATATDTDTDTATDTDPVPLAPRLSPDHTGPALSFALGASLQTDALYAGPRVEYRGLFVFFLDASFTLLAGTAEDYLLVRASFHLRPVLRIADVVRLYPIVGVGVHHGRPIGELGDFCQRLEDGCAVTAVGFELGLGFSWRALGLDLYFATGDVPRLTGLAHATIEL